jgi:hypothetical protein
MTKLLIATPTHGETFYTPYVQSILGLQRLIDRNNWRSIFVSMSYADISESRNFMLTHWYDKTDASHILFVDADMGFDPQLILDMIGFGKPVVGVIAPKRQIDLKRLASLAAKGTPTAQAIARAHDFIVKRGNQPRTTRTVKGFIEVDGCGAGILLIERSCIDTMLTAIPEISDGSASRNSPLAKDLDRLLRPFEILSVDGARLSEDLSFCHRWRNLCGGEIWANIAHEITHVGLQRFTGRYADVMATGPRISVTALDGPLKKAGGNVHTVTSPASDTAGRVSAPEGKPTEKS